MSQIQILFKSNNDIQKYKNSFSLLIFIFINIVISYVPIRKTNFIFIYFIFYI